MSKTNKKQASIVASLYLKKAKSQLEIGKKIEKEHEDIYNKLQTFLKDNGLKMPMTREQFFKDIARDHIKEVKDYYTKLLKHVEPEHKESMDFTGINNILTPDKKLDERSLTRAIRLSISSELDAIHLYELIADATENKDVKKVMNNVANEEKVHVGEFEVLLKTLDKDNEKQKEIGYQEVDKETKK